MSPKQGDYWQKRAEEEVELAQRSSDPIVVQFHYALTELYLNKLHGHDAAPTADPAEALTLLKSGERYGRSRKRRRGAAER